MSPQDEVDWLLDQTTNQVVLMATGGLVLEGGEAILNQKCGTPNLEIYYQTYPLQRVVEH